MAGKILIVVVLIAVFVGGYFLFSRDSASGPQVMEQEKFVEAYVELAALAERMAIGTPEYDQDKERLLASMGITSEQVEKALATYNDHPEMWQPVWERIQEKLEERQQELEAASTAPAPPDSN
jgi:hypothetical protein